MATPLFSQKVTSVNLHDLKSHLKHLLRLQEIKSDDEDENDLANVLVALLWAYLDTRDAEIFRLRFMWTIRDYLYTLDPRGQYSGIIDLELAIQNGYLTNFIRDIRNGTISPKQAAARAKSYATVLGKVREKLRLEEWDDEREAQWQINPMLENCPDCIELSGQIHTIAWWKQNHIPRDGRTRCLFNCGCDISPI